MSIDRNAKVLGRVVTPRWMKLLAPLAFMGLITILSHTPGERIPRFGVWDDILKQVGHAVEFGILALLWLRAGDMRFSTAHRLVISLVITGMFAVSDEIHQLYVPGRIASVTDVAADAIGALLAGLVWLRRSRQISSNAPSNQVKSDSHMDQIWESID